MEGLLGLIQRIRGPPNASTCPTSPSASETPTYGRCLGYVDWNITPFLTLQQKHAVRLLSDLIFSHISFHCGIQVVFK